MVASTGADTEQHHHSVGFYATAGEFAASVGEFVLDGVRHDDTVLVLATADHLAILDSELSRSRIDVADLRATGRYITLDAAAALQRLLVDGTPDERAFEAEIGTFVTTLAAGERPLRIFGEMVGVLWEQGNVAAAIELERQWNELRRHAGFVLHCGYEFDGAGPEGDLTVLGQLCAAHTALATPSWSPTGDRWEEPVADQHARVFLPTAAAVAWARRFVRQVLRGWGYERLADEVVLLASELATNAVLHASSPFEVSLHRNHGRLTLRVRDAGPATPIRRTATELATGGRGLAIVAGLGAAWGVEQHHGGKAVWVEFEPDQLCA